MVSNYLRIWWQKKSRPVFTSLVLWSQSYVVSFPSIYHGFYGGNDSVSAHSFFHILKCSNRMLPFQADIEKICLSCSNQRWSAGKSNMDDPSHVWRRYQLRAQARYACHFSELGEAWAIRDLRQALGSSAPWLVDFPNETSKQLGNFPVATVGIPGTSYRRFGESLLFFFKTNRYK